MKKLLFVLSCLAAALLVSCADEKKPECTDYTTVVPREAVLVAKVDVGALLQKSQMLDDADTRDAVVEVINTMLGSYDLLNVLLADPSACGIDWQQPVLLAVEDLSSNRGVLSMAVADEAQLTAFLQQQHITEGTHDARKFVLSLNRNSSDATSYITTDTTRWAVRDARFADVFAAQQDVALHYNCNLLQGMSAMLGAALPAELSAVPSASPDATGLLSLDFQSGIVVLDHQLTDAPVLASLLSSALKANLTGERVEHEDVTTISLLPELVRQIRREGFYAAMPVIEWLDDVSLDVAESGHQQLRIGLTEKEDNALGTIISFALEAMEDEDD